MLMLARRRLHQANFHRVFGDRTMLPILAVRSRRLLKQHLLLALVVVVVLRNDNVYRSFHSNYRKTPLTSSSVTASLPPASSSSSVRSKVNNHFKRNEHLKRIRGFFSSVLKTDNVDEKENEGTNSMANVTTPTSASAMFAQVNNSIVNAVDAKLEESIFNSNHLAQSFPSKPINRKDLDGIVSGVLSIVLGRNNYRENNNRNVHMSGRTSSTFWSVLLGNTIRYGLLVYIVLELSKMLLDEVNQSLSNIILQQSSDEIIDHDDEVVSSRSGATNTYSQEQQAAYRKHHKQIRDIVQFLVLQEQKGTEQNDEQQERFYEMVRSKSVCNEIYQLALLLRSGGIPYGNAMDYSQSDNKINSTEATPHQPNGLPKTTTSTVETLLQELSVAEISLLQQCLYKINPNDDSAATTITKKRSAKSDNHLDNINIRRNLVGIESIYDQITNTVKQQISTTLPRLNDIHGNDGNENPYSSLFQDSIVSSSASTQSSNNKNNIGILLYGPPGCGKTNLIRTLVHTLQMPCLIITPSILLRKYVGETNLHIRTLFNMIQNKLVPCIVCIDELDGLFRERSHDTEHEVNRELKTEFLQWMDGMMTRTYTTKVGKNSNGKPTIIIGATNRPFDVDTAILRRLSNAYYIGLPNNKQRLELFTLFLKNIPHEILSHDLSYIVSVTAGYTPSDLRQLLQVAALSGPMKRGSSTVDDQKCVEKLTMDDILNAMSVIGPTPLGSHYQQQMEEFRSQRQSLPTNHLSGKHNSNLMYMNTDEDQNNNDSRSFMFRDRTNFEKYDNDKWETIFGNYYNLGTLEVDQLTLDLLKKYIINLQKEEDQPDDSTSNVSNNDDNDDTN